jgi:DNA-binding IclR family transcriptional regulator
MAAAATVVESDPAVKSAVRALRILRFLGAEAAPTSARKIAERCELPKSTMYQLLNALHARHFVTYFPAQRAWGLGIAAFETGSASLRSRPIERLGQPVAAELARLTGETAHVAVLRGTEVVYLIKERPPEGARPLVTAIGVRLPAHLTAVGRALLMHLSDDELEVLYPPTQPLTTRTGRGPTTVAELRRCLVVARERGYAVDEQLTTPGVTCVGAPVFAYDRHATAAIGVTFTATTNDRLRRDRIVQLVCEMSLVLSKRLGWQESAAP